MYCFKVFLCNNKLVVVSLSRIMMKKLGQCSILELRVFLNIKIKKLYFSRKLVSYGRNQNNRVRLGNRSV